MSSESHSVVSDSLQPHGLYSPWNSPGQNSRAGRLSLLQVIPTQGFNPGFPHCKWILYQLNHKGGPVVIKDDAKIPATAPKNYSAQNVHSGKAEKLCFSWKESGKQWNLLHRVVLCISTLPNESGLSRSRASLSKGIIQLRISQSNHLGSDS